MEAILQIKNISKTMNKKKIIDNLSFVVNKGEIFGFLGPNGAGKTTTIKMITGLMKSDCGEIFINGYNLKNDFEKAISEVGGIIESPDMYEYMSGMDNLKLYARMHENISKERIQEVVRLVKLENRINDKVKKYSLGMRQRLGVAQALLHNPKLLILDEPTNGLDPMGIKELRETLKDLAKKGTSTLVSSHLLSEMELMCDRFCIIDQGKLKDIKSLSEIKSKTFDDLSVFVVDTDNIQESKSIIESDFENVKVDVVDDKLRLTTDKEIMAGINKTLVLKGFKVYEISKYSKSLEDEFIEKTESKQIM